MERHFDQDLQQLKERILYMGSLAETMIHIAIKALVDRYAVHFDPALRDQVVARYQKLDLPTYWAGINSDLAAKLDPAGKVTAVSISYPRDFVRQQLSYAAMYGLQ